MYKFKGRNKKMNELKTLSKGKAFKYEGSIKTGTTIHFGDGRKVVVRSTEWTALLKEFNGRLIRIGASRTNPPKGSLGEWLIKNVTKQAIASYLAPILIREGFAKQEGIYKLTFSEFELDE
jgi:hypothetical protein